MEQFVSTWQQLAYVVGTLIRPIGGLLLGAATGWLTATTFLDEDKEWQLKIAIFLGLLGAFVTLNIFSGAGTTGLFAIGAGVAVILLGVRSMQPKKKEPVGK
jgi:predicted membrane channel-forming protein YqfA (hemolysin III family)